MSFVYSYLPMHPGLLPKWQLVVAGLAFFNSAQNLFTLDLTRRIYSNSPSQVSALQSRTFAIWTFLSAIIRFYCAYHIQDKTVYHITIWSYVAALVHFSSEWLLFRTTKLGRGLLGPLIIAPCSILWMVKEQNYYVKG